MMTKERMELAFMMLFWQARRLRDQVKDSKVMERGAETVQRGVESVLEQGKSVLPVTTK